MCGAVWKNGAPQIFDRIRSGILRFPRKEEEKKWKEKNHERIKESLYTCFMCHCSSGTWRLFFH